MSGSTSNVSFKFSKISRSKVTTTQGFSRVTQLQKGGGGDEESEDRNHENEEEAGGPILVSGFSKKGAEDIVTAATKSKTEELLIIPPLANTIKMTTTTPQNQSSSADDDDADQLAKKALLEDAKRLGNSSSEIGIDDTISSIPSQLHDRKDSSSKLDIISEIATDEADYESIPVDAFGKALLRGMGWREGQAIGRAGKTAVAPMITAPRPKGLGLGAEPKLQAPSSSSTQNGSAAEGVELTLKIGAFVKRIDSNTNKTGGDKDRYGKVISLDEDNARVVVQSAIGKTTTRLSYHVVQVVSRTEYEKSAKCINQDAYERYKMTEEDNKKKPSTSTSTKKRRETPEIIDLLVEDEKKRDRGRRSDRDSHSSSLRSKSKHSAEHSSERHRESRREERRTTASSSKSSPAPPPKKTWLRPDMRVRIIDQKYRRGKFYKSKAVIVDLKSASGVCSCLVEEYDGAKPALLDDITEDMLETVVPRKNGALVMIVRGSSAGKVGAICERDSRECVAVVKLADDSSEPLKTVSYDDICEYTGDHEF